MELYKDCIVFAAEQIPTPRSLKQYTFIILQFLCTWLSWVLCLGSCRLHHGIIQDWILIRFFSGAFFKCPRVVGKINFLVVVGFVAACFSKARNGDREREREGWCGEGDRKTQELEQEMFPSRVIIDIQSEIPYRCCCTPSSGSSLQVPVTLKGRQVHKGLNPRWQRVRVVSCPMSVCLKNLVKSCAGRKNERV